MRVIVQIEQKRRTKKTGFRILSFHLLFLDFIGFKKLFQSSKETEDPKELFFNCSDWIMMLKKADNSLTSFLIYIKKN